jgi:hypothetical protein
MELKKDYYYFVEFYDSELRTIHDNQEDTEPLTIKFIGKYVKSDNVYEYFNIVEYSTPDTKPDSFRVVKGTAVNKYIVHIDVD